MPRNSMPQDIYPTAALPCTHCSASPPHQAHACARRQDTSRDGSCFTKADLFTNCRPSFPPQLSLQATCLGTITLMHRCALRVSLLASQSLPPSMYAPLSLPTAGALIAMSGRCPWMASTISSTSLLGRSPISDVRDPHGSWGLCHVLFRAWSLSLMPTCRRQLGSRSSRSGVTATKCRLFRLDEQR